MWFLNKVLIKRKSRLINGCDFDAKRKTNNNGKKGVMNTKDLTTISFIFFFSNTEEIVCARIYGSISHIAYKWLCNFFGYSWSFPYVFFLLSSSVFALFSIGFFLLTFSESVPSLVSMRITNLGCSWFMFVHVDGARFWTTEIIIIHFVVIDFDVSCKSHPSKWWWWWTPICIVTIYNYGLCFYFMCVRK